MEIKDANGNILKEGDTVIAVKDLPVKGWKDIKRGDKFKKIRFEDDGNLLSGGMVLKPEFFKKAKK
jgi:protein PhnA